MKIEYFGHSCFRLTSDSGVRLITDPYTRVGYELPKGLQAEIVTVSHGHFDHNYIDGLEKFEEVWNIAGIHDYAGVTAVAISSSHDDKGGALRGRNLIFKVTMDGLTVCHLGDLGEKRSPELCEKIGRVDVLLIPIGGTYTVDAYGAKEYVDAIRPKIAIPMHYRPKDGTIDISDEKAFLQLFGGEANVRSENTVIVNKERLTNVGTEILFMERKA